MTTTDTNKKARPRGAQEYKGNGKHTWEDVSEGGATRRLRVPGGWIYVLEDELSGHSSVFVPVPDAVGYAV